ncbi:MAG: hypothetical protein MUO39_15370 [Steroidobacteraceae bacterium]|nr:hypothetical protein [Steroidobacteraceae bacterium]
MGSFEYAMVLVSIIVGLGITHILASLGSAVHRLQGHGRPLRLELNYLVWICFMFTWLAQFWWFEFKWSQLEPQFGFLLFGFLVLYAVTLFLVTVILVPHHLVVVDDSWQYFLSIRPWFFGGVLLLSAIDLLDTFMKGLEWGARSSYLSYWAAVLAGATIGLFSRRRRVHLAVGLVLLVWSNLLTVYEQGVLGGW